MVPLGRLFSSEFLVERKMLSPPFERVRNSVRHLVNIFKVWSSVAFKGTDLCETRLGDASRFAY